MRIWVLAAIATCISSGPAAARPPLAPPTTKVTAFGAETSANRKGDGNELWQICWETTSADPPIECMSYIEGVLDERDFGVAGYTRYLIPDDVTVGQITEVVRNYLSKHPERRSHFAPGIIQQALSEAWPAPK